MDGFFAWALPFLGVPLVFACVFHGVQAVMGSLAIAQRIDAIAEVPQPAVGAVCKKLSALALVLPSFVEVPRVNDASRMNVARHLRRSGYYGAAYLGLLAAYALLKT